MNVNGYDYLSVSDAQSIQLDRRCVYFVTRIKLRQIAYYKSIYQTWAGICLLADATRESVPTAGSDVKIES